MDNQFTRQTRWAHDPEPVEPDDVPPGGIYVRQVQWVPCLECDLQVHAATSAYLLTGITCPECGARLAHPGVLGNPDVVAERVRQIEDYLRDLVEPGAPFAEE